MTTHPGPIPLSSAQEGLWLAEIANPGTATFNLPLALSWAGTVDADALAAALRTVAARHDILRTTYQFVEDRPVQVIGADAPVPVEVVDLTGAEDPPALAEHQALARAVVPFDLAADRQLRCTVWRRPPADDLVLLCAHHIAVDAWGMSLLLTELATAYQAYQAGDRPDLPEIRFQYANFAIREDADLDGPAARRLLHDRADKLRPVPTDPVLGGQGPVRGRRRGGQVTFTMPDDLRQAAQRRSRAQRTTMFTILLSAWQTLLARRSGRTRFLLGAPMANRQDVTSQGLIGCFTNLVPLRCQVDPRWTFDDLCRRTAAETLTAFACQHLPYQRLVAATHGSSVPLVSTVVGLHAIPQPPGPWWDSRYLPTGTAKFDLNVLVEDNGTRLTGTIEHDIDRCPRSEVDALLIDLAELFR